MQTRVTGLLKTEYPIIQGGMAWVAEHHLAAAVSRSSVGISTPQVSSRDMTISNRSREAGGSDS